MKLNTIVNGNCLEIMKDIPSKSVDLVLTDPPYGINIANNPFRQKFKKSNWDNKPMGSKILKEIFRVSKNQIIWGGNYFNLPPTQCFYVWDKVQPQKFSSSMCEMAWVSKKSPAKLFKKRVVSIEKWHPTTKPVELMEWCINFFPEANLILDPFIGSGTTALACQNLKRNFIGIEISKEYCDIANKRLAQKPLL